MTTTATNEPKAPKNPRGRFWPFALIGLLVVGAGSSLTMVYVAVNDPSFAVENDYYQKALHWDKTVAQRRLNARLGWQVKVTVPKAAEGKGRRPRLQLLDRAGKLLVGGRVELVMFHSARASKRYLQTLQFSKKDRVYVGKFMPPRPGLWVCHVRVFADGKRFTTKTSVWVG